MACTTNKTIKRNRRKIFCAWAICILLWACLQYAGIVVSQSAFIALLQVSGAAIALLMLGCIALMVYMRRDQRIRRFMDGHYADTVEYATKTVVLASIVFASTAFFTASPSIALRRAVCQIGIFAYITELVFGAWNTVHVFFYIRCYFRKERKPLTAKDVVQSNLPLAPTPPNKPAGKSKKTAKKYKSK